MELIIQRQSSFQYIQIHKNWSTFGHPKYYKQQHTNTKHIMMTMIKIRNNLRLHQCKCYSKSACNQQKLQLQARSFKQDSSPRYQNRDAWTNSPQSTTCVKLNSDTLMTKHHEIIDHLIDQPRQCFEHFRGTNESCQSSRGSQVQSGYSTTNGAPKRPKVLLHADSKQQHDAFMQAYL